MIILKRNFLTRGIIIENSQDDNAEHVTVDLTVGDKYQIAGRAEWHQLDDSHTLVPNRCILVQTRERVLLPANVFGILCSKGSLSARGLIISNTKVDPIFGDYLSIPLFNAGGSPLEIKAGMKFCSIYFQELEQPIPQLAYRKAVTQWTTRHRPFRDFLVTNSNSGVIVSVIISALITYFLTNCRHESSPPIEQKDPAIGMTNTLPSTSNPKGNIVDNPNEPSGPSRQISNSITPLNAKP